MRHSIPLLVLVVALSTGLTPSPVAQDASSELKAVREELRQLNDSVKQLLLMLNEKAALDRRTGVMTQIATLDAGILALEQSLGDLEARAEATKDEVADLKRELERGEAQLRSDEGLASVMTSQMRSMIESHRDKIERREARLAELQRQVLELQGTIENRKQMRVDLERELAPS